MGWWHSTQDIVLYAEPDFAAQKLKAVPSGIWLYALETVSLVVPTRGLVVKAGGAFKICDVIYYAYTNYDEGESWDKVWRKGEIIEYQDDSGAEIQWIGGLQRADPYRDDGWWVRLRGQNDEAGWAWASARDGEFACKWDRDPEAICAPAPAKRVPNEN